MNTISLNTLIADSVAATKSDDNASFATKQIVNLRKKFLTDATIKGDVLRWKSNNRCVPLSILNDARVVPEKAHIDTVNAEDKAAIEMYIKNQQNLTKEQKAEQAFEMRAAFGEGKKITNCITGKVHNT